MTEVKKVRVVCGMSGGVDSSATAVTLVLIATATKPFARRPLGFLKIVAGFILCNFYFARISG